MRNRVHIIAVVALLAIPEGIFAQSAPAIEWQQSLGGSGDDRVNCIQQTSDGRYILTGSSNSTNGDVSGNHDTSGFYLDYWVVKLSTSGAIEWQKSLGGSQNDEANS